MNRIIKITMMTVAVTGLVGCGGKKASKESEKEEVQNIETVEVLLKERPDYINPYYYGKTDAEQIDFSQDYLELRSKWFLEEENILPQFVEYDFSSIWLTENREQNGILGKNFQRIQFHFSKITKSPSDFMVYLVEGKSKVNNNICSFKGEIKLMKWLLYDYCDNPDFDKCGSLFAYYTFYEDSTDNHSGVFTGIVESSVHVDKTQKKVLLDESSYIADGYWNNTFVGIWTNYKTQQSKKCIWGNYRLPFSHSFDCGDGEMIVCDEYVKNGWQTFNNHSEYIEVDNGKWELKNKWWK